MMKLKEQTSNSGGKNRKCFKVYGFDQPFQNVQKNTLMEKHYCGYDFKTKLRKRTA